MKFAIYPYKPESNSAKVLSEAIGCKRIKHQSSKFNKWNNPKWWTINLGSTKCPSGSRVLNSALNVSNASNKLSYLNLIKDYANVPEFTSDPEIARGWASNERLVVCRTKLNAHSGEGIIISDTPESVVPAPLYTRYVRKDSEWRLHFAFDPHYPFYIQRKKRKTETIDNVDNRVRSVKTGWIYSHENAESECPYSVLVEGGKAFAHSGLDFGAIDILYRRSTDTATILECNTCPGMQGLTVQKYAEQFLQLTS